MKQLLTKTLNSQFISASLWVFLGTGVLNVGNYVFHLLMGRMLGLSLYGVLESLISVIYILFVPTLTLNLVIVKFVSSYKGKNDSESISNLYSYVLRQLVLYGVIITGLLLLFSPILKSFLHLPSILLVVILAFTFFVNLFDILNKSFLQGVSYFFKFSLINVIETLGKLLLSVALVYLGFKVEGAFASVGIGILAAFLISQLFMKDVVKKMKPAAAFPHKKSLVQFAIPAFIATLSITSLFTSDIILVRHFFSGVASGYYSALSVLGKIIYFAASPIIFVIFPMISEYHAKGENYQKFLILGLGITLFVSIIITAVYFFAPDIMIKVLFGTKYLPAAGLLGIFGIFISIYSVCSLFTNYYLSIHRTSVAYLALVAALFQIVLISFLHSSLSQVIWMSIGTCFLLLILLLLYYPRAKS